MGSTYRSKWVVIVLMALAVWGGMGVYSCGEEDWEKGDMMEKSHPWGNEDLGAIPSDPGTNDGLFDDQGEDALESQVLSEMEARKKTADISSSEKEEIVRKAFQEYLTDNPEEKDVFRRLQTWASKVHSLDEILEETGRAHQTREDPGPSGQIYKGNIPEETVQPVQMHAGEWAWELQDGGHASQGELWRGQGGDSENHGETAGYTWGMYLPPNRGDQVPEIPVYDERGNVVGYLVERF